MAARDDVKRLLAEGLKQREIAEKLGISAGRVSQLAKEIAAASPPPPKAKTKSAKPGGKPAPKGNQYAKGNPGGIGGPVANRHAVTHGLYETVEEFLTPQERKAYSSASVEKLAQIDHELRILTIRERRMLERIDNLKKQADERGMTVVEEGYEEGFSGTGPLRKSSKKRMGILGQIQSIEDALTKVQNTKAKLIEVKAKIEAKDTPDETGGVSDFLKALNAKAADVWADESEGEGVDSDA